LGNQKHKQKAIGQTALHTNELFGSGKQMQAAQLHLHDNTHSPLFCSEASHLATAGHGTQTPPTKPKLGAQHGQQSKASLGLATPQTPGPSNKQLLGKEQTALNMLQYNATWQCDCRLAVLPTKCAERTLTQNTTQHRVIQHVQEGE
jgi:hypothetical protein